MNKYEQELMKVTPKGAIIYELIQEDINSRSVQIFEFLGEGILAFGKALNRLKKMDAFFLVINDEKSELVQIQSNLTKIQQDVTRAVQAASNKKSFEFEGKRYKLYRKIR
ncbi:hypothetical protein [Neobacillus vireti]|uniref:hypothetical protein n=1 Tax=Neobacillus vireti TaxID=220686 RepID=UPI003000DBB7